MNLYEVIFWGADGYDNDEDTIYLVRAPDWRAAVEDVRTNASPSIHKIHRSTLAHRVHEIGTDASPLGEPREQILRGPYFQCAYNHGWRAWDRQMDPETADYTSEWKEETHAA
ncbi:MAG: hypothetical protein ABMA26_24560 [Limisphaerales bacterium]